MPTVGASCVADFEERLRPPDERRSEKGTTATETTEPAMQFARC